MKIITMITRFFNLFKSTNEAVDNSINIKDIDNLPLNEILDNPDDIHRNYAVYQDKQADDIVYFPKLNAYGVFKYNIVKDVLTDNKAIWVSEVHRQLSTLYFSIDETKHENNKAAAFKHLDFFAKKLQNEPDEYIGGLFQSLVTQFPINEEFNLVKHLVNPLVLINKLNEYGFLDYLPEYDYRKKEYQHEQSIEIIQSIFEGRYTYDDFIEKYMNDVGVIPQKLQKLINDMQSDMDITDELLKNFLSSLMFAGSHSTASFLSSWISTLFTKHTDLLKNKNASIEDLHILADEVLRIYTPVSYIYRTVRQNITYKGKELKEGDTVIVFVGAANLDQSVYENPLAIQLGRKEQHFAFGMGAYVCLGRFAVYRAAKNVFHCLADYADRIQFTNEDNPHAINGAILKQSELKVTFK